MNLWVRSQDKTILRKVNTLGIVEGIDFWSIDENLTVSFGKYKTKERAIEILDEIQDKMLNGAFAKKINGLGEELDLIPNPILIYNMPEN